MRTYELQRPHTLNTSNNTSAANVVHCMEEEHLFQRNGLFSFLQQSLAVPSLVLSTIGYIANILVIIVILSGPLRHSVFMSLLVVLAITDIFALLASNLIHPGVFGKVFGHAHIACRILSFLVLSVETMSSWIIVLISTERYIAIFYPLKVRFYITLKRISFVIFCLTLVICASNVYYLLTSYIMTFNVTPVCVLDGQNLEYNLIFSILTGLFYSIIPFCIITTLNFSILKKLKSERTFPLSGMSINRVNSLIPMMFAISVLFVVTTIPISVLTIISCVFRVTDHDWDDWVFLLTVGLVNLNHCLNFFLYCITGSVFRGALLALFRCRKTQHLGRSLKQQVLNSSNAL